MKHTLLVLILIAAFSVGVSFPLRATSAQFIDRIVRPCSSGATPRAQVVVNPNNTGNVAITTCTGGTVLVNGAGIAGSSPGGANTQVQFNDAGVFAGDAGLTFVKATDALTVVGPILGSRFNGLAITNNGTNTLAIAAGKTFTVSNTITQTATDGAAVAFGLGGTVVYTGLITGSGLTQGTARLLGRSTAGVGGIEEITLGTNLSFTGTTLNVAPGGADTQVQFNDAGVLSGDTSLLYNKTTNELSVDTLSVLSTISILGGTVVTSSSITVPTVSGGTANGSDLILQGSSGAAPAASYVIVNPQTVAGTSPGGMFIGAPVSSTLDAANVSDMLHLQSSNAKNANITLDVYGASVRGVIVGRQASGTAAAPTATVANGLLFSFGARGFETTGNVFSTLNMASISMVAAENFTNVAQGTYVVFNTTPIGTVAPAERLRITDNGTLNVNAATLYSAGTPGIAGNGTLNANSDDSAGKVTSTGTGASTVVLTFSAAFTRAPACFVNNETTANLARAVSTTTTATLNATVVTGDVISYVCMGY